MAGCCDACGRPFTEPADNQGGSALARLRMACAMLEIRASWDGYVSEADAARLIGRSAKTLSNRRHAEGLAHRKAPGRFGRIEYSLTDLACLIAA
jgi:hypothetical protein